MLANNSDRDSDSDAHTHISTPSSTPATPAKLNGSDEARGNGMGPQSHVMALYGKAVAWASAVHSSVQGLLTRSGALREDNAVAVLLAFGILMIILLGTMLACFHHLGHEDGSKFEASPAVFSAGRASNNGFAKSPGPTRDSLRSPGSAKDLSDQFCPELVVPTDNECILLVPVLPRPSEASGECDFKIADLEGNSVLCFSVPPRASLRFGDNDRHEHIQLKTASDPGQVLAYCSKLQSSGQARVPAEYTLHRHTGDVFAKVVWEAAQRRYTINASSFRVHFEGAVDNNGEHVLNVKDAKGDLLATADRYPLKSDPKKDYYRLRVAPLSDVGLMLCGLFAWSSEVPPGGGAAGR